MNLIKRGLSVAQVVMCDSRLVSSESAKTPVFSAVDKATKEEPSASLPAKPVLPHTARVPAVLRP
jgi:hypothetical protein